MDAAEPKPNKYFTVYLQGLPVGQMDEITEMVFSEGASGTEEMLPFQQPNLEYEAQPIETETTELKIYFLRPPSHELLAKLHNLFGCTVHIQEDEHKDWLEEWKKGFEPFCLAGDVWVVPSWRQKPAEAGRAIYMEPGMAFGTGTHATTKLAAELLADIPGAGKSLLDVGTGTGILAILAKYQGFDPVGVNDIDPEARRVARENCELNKVEVHTTDKDVGKIDGAFDVVVANIIDGVLLKIGAELLRLTKVGGELILSGILLEREAGFVPAFTGENWEVLSRVQCDEWVAFHLKRIH